MENQVEGNVSACQCQLLGTLPNMRHLKNRESDSVRMNSNSERGSRYRLANFAGNAQLSNPQLKRRTLHSQSYCSPVRPGNDPVRLRQYAHNVVPLGFFQNIANMFSCGGCEPSIRIPIAVGGRRRGSRLEFAQWDI